MIQEVEEEVAFASLPSEVKGGLTARAKNEKITKVKSLTKQDQLVAYEAQVEKNGKQSEIQVGPNGERLPREAERAVSAPPDSARRGFTQSGGEGPAFHA